LLRLPEVDQFVEKVGQFIVPWMRASKPACDNIAQFQRAAARCPSSTA
jgi:hypothetical protein